MASLDQQLDNYRLTTVQIFYHMPDFQELLQEFVWQNYDIAPRFPELHKFLDFWDKEIEGKVHSVYVGDAKIITPGDYRFPEFQGTLQ